jgi:prevent-host-death family protein
MTWQLQDAKARFSEVIQRARLEGPQTVTLRGERAAVVVSAADFDRLTAGEPDFVAALLAGPTWDDDMIEGTLGRARDLPRITDF